MSSYIWSKLLFRHSASVLITAAGGSIVYGVSTRKHPLYNDSHETWPTRGVTGQEKQDEGSQSTGAVAGSLKGSSADSNAQGRSDHNDTPSATFSSRFAYAKDSLPSTPWSSLTDHMLDLALPDWVQDIPGQVNKLQTELTMAPGSLADEIWQEAQDPYFNPEIVYPARVRVGKSLCKDELEFRARRKQHTAAALAKYLELPENEVDPEDVPTIAMCGSGGGLRALVAGASSYLSAQEAGLFDCVTYTAGVSGSCWLQTLYYSSICGQRHNGILEHLKHRIGVHIAYPPTALELFTRAPTNKFLLSGCVEKLRGDSTADFGIVDVYGLLLAARLLVPRGDLGVNPFDLKISNQRAYLTRGEHPLPIYTAVRHEIPVQVPKDDIHKADVSESLKEKAKKESWFQWFEFTPYELWCEELDAGIPTYAVGRRFERGASVLSDDGLGQPEVRTPLLMGIWGSAFCATLAHYYKEIRPIVKGLTGFGGIDDLAEDKNDELIKVHPIDPASIPNYAIGLDKAQLSSTTPKSIFSSERLQLMDAGMSNNLPIYPLLREGRDVDVLIAFDASADIKSENWLSVVDGYAKQHGIKGWPLGSGWPRKDKQEDRLTAELHVADAVSAQEAGGKVANARDESRKHSTAGQDKVDDLGYCNVWVGTTMQRESDEEPPQSKRLEPDMDWKVQTPDAGIAVVYFPFLPNPNVEGVDPNTSDFMSTWNFIYTPHDIEKVVSLARANFNEGKEQTRRTIRAVYMRKKAKRLEAEEKNRVRRWKHQLRESGDHFG